MGCKMPDERYKNFLINLTRRIFPHYEDKTVKKNWKQIQGIVDKWMCLFLGKKNKNKNRNAQKGQNQGIIFISLQMTYYYLRPCKSTRWSVHKLQTTRVLCGVHTFIRNTSSNDFLPSVDFLRISPTSLEWQKKKTVLHELRQFACVRACM